MATRKAKPVAKPARKAALRRPMPKAAARKAAPKKAAAKTAQAKAPAPKRGSIWSAAQKSEFGTIQARAKTLSANLKKTDFDDDGSPLPGSPWAAVLADLDAWARKYKVTFAAREHDHAAGADTGDAAADGAGATPLAYRAACPGSFSETSKRRFVGVTQVRTTNCTLRRQTWLGRCVYDCVETVEWI